MNENNRQFGYTSQKNKTNSYVDDIRFEPSRTGFAKQRQISYVIGRFASVSDMLDYVSPDSQLIRNIRDDVAKNPSKYGGISTNAFLKSYQNIFEIMNNICLIYNKTGNMTDKIFKQGFSAFNENLYNDLVAGKLSYIGFVHATVVMGNSLVPYYTPIKEGPNDERSC